MSGGGDGPSSWGRLRSRSRPSITEWRVLPSCWCAWPSCRRKRRTSRLGSGARGSGLMEPSGRPSTFRAEWPWRSELGASLGSPLPCATRRRCDASARAWSASSSAWLGSIRLTGASTNARSASGREARYRGDAVAFDESRSRLGGCERRMVDRAAAVGSSFALGFDLNDAASRSAESRCKGIPMAEFV